MACASLSRMPDVAKREGSNEPIAAAGDGLHEVGVLAESDTDSPDGEVDVLVVRHSGVRPQPFANLFARHDFTRVFEQ